MKKPTTKRAKIFMSVWSVLTLCVVCFSTTAFATGGDPITVVNNLSDFIFSAIKAIGIIILGWGIVQVGMSIQSHDASQRSQGFLPLSARYKRKGVMRFTVKRITHFGR